MNNTQKERRSIYKNVELISEGFLSVSQIHTVYYEECGNPNGLPVLILHGGPGGGSQVPYRGYFDPSAYRIIQFDQRGCGKSTPFCCLEENTTWDLVEDIEKIRIHLSIQKWHTVLGGSWGATLALIYAQAHPQMVAHIILRGVFLSRKWELKFLYQEGTNFFYPDYYDELKNLLPEDQQDNLLHNFLVKLTSNTTSQEEKEKIAKAWTKWEMVSSKIVIDEQLLKMAEDTKFALSLSIIECYYLDNICFFRNENQILEDCDKISHIPTIIVQGRHDSLCPPKSAWELHQKLPLSKLRLVEDAGHSSSEPGILDEILNATDLFKSDTL